MPDYQKWESAGEARPALSKRCSSRPWRDFDSKVVEAFPHGWDLPVPNRPPLDITPAPEDKEKQDQPKQEAE